jgi:hypothetical protein
MAHCIESSIKRKAFGRALRVKDALDTEKILATVGAPSGPIEEQAD